ncbi:GAF domain-containing sensor histidine kinase [Jeotgalicoccus meleagridis]|uniref:histidine kinase n=1 Tax=Jeotgalicoccus meleagridis TaxID=2759181 RepID=A0A6V7RQP4_9STAP|nr:GAF domain-containing sensor histidine kinase [Jeotgalicoccus meleagridis]CAD2081258.1 Sensor histidine kinase LiaS [Jeotgalicoccus meleagridis]
MKSKLQLLKDIAEFLNAETHRQAMIDGALRLLIDHSNFETGWVFLINNQGEHELSAYYQLPPSLEENDHQYLCNDKCWCVNKFNKKELVKATNIVACSRLERAARSEKDSNNHITHHATVPLFSGSENFGLLNVATPYTKEFQQDELDLLESVAFQLGSSLKRLDLTVKEKESMIMQERQRLARELHDSVNQMLFSIGITSHAAQSLKESEQIEGAFKRIGDTSKYAMQEMKALIWQLKPIGLENGIIDAIENYAKILQLEVEVTVTGFYNLADDVELEIYRIIQESLNNVRKHANTDAAEVALELTDKVISIQIKDLGQGFDLKASRGLSHGISNMRERTRNIGGKFEIQSAANQGTIIRVVIPKG